MIELTAFCQDANGTGTVWIDLIEIPYVNALDDDAIALAKTIAAEACAAAWGYEDVSQIHVLGLARGDVDIVTWDDIEA